MSPTSPYFSNRGSRSWKENDEEIETNAGVRWIFVFTSWWALKGRFPTRREVMRSTSDGGRRNDILKVNNLLSEITNKTYVKRLTHREKDIWHNEWLEFSKSPCHSGRLRIGIFFLLCNINSNSHTPKRLVLTNSASGGNILYVIWACAKERNKYKTT